MSDVLIPSERMDILLEANHEASVILSVLQRYIDDDNDSYETRIFARGQLARLSELSSLVLSAIDPDFKGDDIASLHLRLKGFHISESANV